jgi:hypothetical protein
MGSDNGQLFGAPVTELIEARASVRTYVDRPVPAELRERITRFLAELQDQAEIRVRFQIIDTDVALQEAGARLGTYGMIRGASSFVAAAVGQENSSEHIEKLGYLLEKMVLLATSLGLGTCWLGGTFDRAQFGKAIGLRDDELLPVVTPLGYARKSMRLQDRAVRLFAGSNRRKGWEELFYEADFQHVLSRSAAGAYAVPLEMVRIAPSASNRQPWRIVRDGEAFYLYLQRTRGYRNLYNFDLQKIDTGIAMCHFELTARELGLAGRWTVQPPVPEAGELPDDTEYIASWSAAGPQPD